MPMLGLEILKPSNPNQFQSESRNHQSSANPHWIPPYLYTVLTNQTCFPASQGFIVEKPTCTNVKGTLHQFNENPWTRSFRGAWPTLVESCCGMLTKNAHSSRRYPFWMLVCWCFRTWQRLKIIAFSWVNSPGKRMWENILRCLAQSGKSECKEGAICTDSYEHLRNDWEVKINV